MNWFTATWHTVFYQPIFNLLILIVLIMPNHDLGLAIIVMTFIVKLAMWPLTQKALKSQKAMAQLQPKVAELKVLYKTNQEKLGKELMALYAKEKVSPATSCVLVLVQLPIFIALYRALSKGVGSEGLDALYAFVPNPGTIKPTLLGFLDLAHPSIPLAIAAGAAQFVQGWLTVRQTQPHQPPGSKDEETMAMVNKQMMYMMPVLTVFIGWKMPAGLSLYWFVMTALSAIQQYLLVKPFMKFLNRSPKLPTPPAPPAAA
jgi:YidC/Oxa1 family membrane protein insertase